MKNHELLDLIGEVNEDYVLEAGNNVAKPRFRWKTFAACAACAALVLAAYPVYRAVNPPLHGYALMEGGGILDTQNEIKSPASGSEEVFSGEDTGGHDNGQGNGIDGIGYSTPGQDAPVQEEAAEQYDKLLQGMGVCEEGKWRDYPAWFAGAWIEGENLVVALVEDSRTPDLEAKIREWTEGDIEIRGAKYSYTYLDSLMDPVTQALDGTGLSCGIGVEVMENCLGVDLYGNGAEIPDSILAKLAELDPAGDAIRVRVFTQSMNTLTDEVAKGPEGAIAAPEPNAAAPDSVSRLPEAREEVGAQETTQPARQVEELPQQKEPRLESK